MKRIPIIYTDTNVLDSYKVCANHNNRIEFCFDPIVVTDFKL
jgi:hypothetical protein